MTTTMTANDNVTFWLLDRWSGFQNAVEAAGFHGACDWLWAEAGEEPDITPATVRRALLERLDGAIADHERRAEACGLWAEVSRARDAREGDLDALADFICQASPVQTLLAEPFLDESDDGTEWVY